LVFGKNEFQLSLDILSPIVANQNPAVVDQLIYLTMGSISSIKYLISKMRFVQCHRVVNCKRTGDRQCVSEQRKERKSRKKEISIA